MVLRGGGDAPAVRVPPGFAEVSRARAWYALCSTVASGPCSLLCRQRAGYSEEIGSKAGPMKRRTIACTVVMLALMAGTALADQRSQARAQVEFGIAVAQKGLWREAIFRWEKAVELDPNYAAAYNNLAIGYEHEGEFDKARQAYEKASKLDPKNAFIRQNYDFFKEINDRAKSSTPR